jgi:hypothetical protein
MAAGLSSDAFIVAEIDFLRHRESTRRFWELNKCLRSCVTRRRGFTCQWNIQYVQNPRPVRRAPQCDHFGISENLWRRRGDSNPRDPFGPNGFQADDR